MKTLRILVAVILAIVILAILATSASAMGKVDEWGYNYQANLFNGMYCDAYRGATWCQEFADVHLQMKWNDAWMNEDKIRHEGFPTYRGSGAWLTNHQRGEYLQGNKVCKWEYFVKIVAAPIDGYKADGNWYSVDGVELGEVIWGDFYVLQDVTNDRCADLHGLQYKPSIPGLGVEW